jgi:hypothetical protein
MNLAAQKFTRRPEKLPAAYLLAAGGGRREERDFGLAGASTGNIIGGTAYLLMGALAARPQ